MDHDEFTTSAGDKFNIEIAPAPKDGKKHPVVVLVHGNFGLVGTFGDQLRNFAKEIAGLGYLAALPNLYLDAEPHPTDTDIAGKLPTLKAAIKHLSDNRPDGDIARLGLVGFSLGGGVAMSYINDSTAGAVKVFADFYGLVEPLLGDGVAKFPPTIIFHNKNDKRFVPPDKNSLPLADALAKSTPKIEHEYHEYDEVWALGFNHAFEPGKHADTDSRDRTKKWLAKYL